MPLSGERCFKFVLLAMILVSSAIAAIGIYIGIELKNIVLMSSVLVLVILILGFVSEFTEFFKDHISEEELTKAKSSDINTLKRNTS